MKLFKKTILWAQLAAATLAATVAVQAQQPVLFTPLHGFGVSNDASRPLLPLILGQGNVLYGSALNGGTNGSGALFKLNIDGSNYSVFYNFTREQASLGFPDGAGGTPLVQGADGSIYGTIDICAEYSNGVVFKVNTDGSSFTALHSFATTDAAPLSLTPGSGGMLYGAGYYSVFELDTNGSNYMVLHTFNSTNDGTIAFGKLIQDANGTLYGTTFASGTNLNGTVFKLNSDGTGFTVLHSFPAFAGDGAAVRAGLVLGSDGALYGTTTLGGTNDAGTVFMLNTDGSDYQVLRSFLTNGVDGQAPYGALVQGLDNKLYGTTINGGTNGAGTLFDLDLGGGDYRVLYDIGTVFGIFPAAGLIQGPALNGSGVLYGVASLGGTGAGGGELFGLTVNPPLTITPGVSQTGAVYWPAWAVGYLLQSTTNLTSGNWVPATNGVPISGLEFTNTTGPNRFYRLVLPSN